MTASSSPRTTPPVALDAVTDSHLAQQSLERGLRLVIDQSRVGSATIVLVTLGLGALFVPAAGWRLYLGWWLVVLAGVLLRQVWFERLRQREAAARPMDVLRVTIASAITGWLAMLCMPIFGPYLAEHRLIMLMGLMIAWMVAAVSVLGVVPKVYLGYMLACMATLMGSMWQRFTLAEISPFLVALPLGVLMMYRLSTGIHGLIGETVSLGLQSESLAHRLELALAEQKSAFEARSRFLASASHDLKQPVHALSLLVNVLKQTRSDERRQQVVVEIEQATRSVNGMFTSLMDMAHIDAGSLRASMSPVDVRSLLKTTLAGFSDLCEHKGLRFSLHVADAPVVNADPLLLQRIVGNLLDNALKYTDRGEITAEVLKSDHGVELVVRDTGPGIAETDLEGLFQPFTRGQHVHSLGIAGLGLGLAIVAHMSELMGMGLKVQSQPGQGTTFRQLMQSATPVEDMTMNAPSYPSLKGRRVWLVEDDQLVRSAMQLWLAEAGADVTAVANPSALQETAMPTPDLLIADYNLGPGHISGADLIEWIRQRHMHLPCILVTGEASVHLKSTGVTMLRKPVSTANLAAAVKESLDAERQPHP
jgi:signal transduction histidine kinase